jgi:predicted ATPase
MNKVGGSEMTEVARLSGSYIFLSYASVNRERALQIADLLEGNGVAVWIDRKDIAGGTSWSAEIVEGIKGCAVLAVLISPASVASRNVQQEIQLAWENDRKVLPLILETATLPSSIEYALAGRQWVEVLDRPDAEWLAQAQRALRGLGVEATVPDVTPRSPSNRRSPDSSADEGPLSNLPGQTTSFVGRETEIGEIRRLLLDRPGSVRLFTLTGAGGCGKTRLALEIASGLVDQFTEGVWLVELAPLADPVLVAQTVASTLGIREIAGIPLLKTLAEALRPRNLLLVLDNCEHVIDASARLADSLIRGCPGVQILATTRELLGVVGEHARQVQPLAAPDARTLSAHGSDLVAYVRQHDAIRLFVDRAQLIAPSFELTDQNAPFVAQICQRLDGIPLALELAAARVRVLSVEQIASRLNDRFRLLTGGSRTALRRQQTLRALIDWSYDSLPDAEQSLLRGLSVFAGGWTLEAAEAVCGDGGPIAREDVLDLLTRVVDKSLVVADEREGVGWFSFLETIRQYLGEKLLEAGEAEQLRRRHADWCQNLVWSEKRIDTNRLTMERLELQIDNLRAALEWCLEADPVQGLALMERCSFFFSIRGDTAELRRRLGAFLDRVPDRTGSRSLSLSWSGSGAWDEGDYASARLLGEEALAIARETESGADVLPMALGMLAYVEWAEGNLGRARGLIEELWHHVRDRQDGFTSCTLQHLGGFDWLDGKIDWALEKNLRAIAIARKSESLGWLGWSLVQRGGLARLVGDVTQAEDHLDEALDTFRKIDERPGIAMATVLLGYLAGLAQDRPRSNQLLRPSLLALRDLGHRPRIAGCLSLVGMLRARQGDLVTATRLLAMTTPIHLRQDPALYPWFRDDLEATLSLARTQLGEARFAAEWARGQETPFDQAIAEVLAELSTKGSEADEAG